MKDLDCILCHSTIDQVIFDTSSTSKILCQLYNITEEEEAEEVEEDDDDDGKDKDSLDSLDYKNKDKDPHTRIKNKLYSDALHHTCTKCYSYLKETQNLFDCLAKIYAKLEILREKINSKMKFKDYKNIKKRVSIEIETITEEISTCDNEDCEESIPDLLADEEEIKDEEEEEEEEIENSFKVIPKEERGTGAGGVKVNGKVDAEGCDDEDDDDDDEIIDLTISAKVMRALARKIENRKSPENGESTGTEDLSLSLSVSESESKSEKSSKSEKQLAPSRPSSALADFEQITLQQYKRDNPGENINIPEFSKKCAKLWEEMSNEYRNKYKDQIERLRKKQVAQRQTVIKCQFCTFSCTEAESSTLLSHIGENHAQYFVSSDSESDSEDSDCQNHEPNSKKDKGQGKDQGQGQSQCQVEDICDSIDGPKDVYTIYVKSSLEEYKEENPRESINFVEFSKHCVTQWESLSEEDKKLVQIMVDQEKELYEAKMNTFEMDIILKVAKEKMKKKGPNNRRRLLTGVANVNIPNSGGGPIEAQPAFYWFCREQIDKIKARHSYVYLSEVATEIRKFWADAPKEVKAKYKQMAEKDKARYDKEIEEMDKNKQKVEVKPVQKKLKPRRSSFVYKPGNNKLIFSCQYCNTTFTDHAKLVSHLGTHTHEYIKPDEADLKKNLRKPLGPRSAFDFFRRISMEEHQERHPGQVVIYSDFTEGCEAHWKRMKLRDKKLFMQMAKDDEKRYEDDLRIYKLKEKEREAKAAKKEMMCGGGGSGGVVEPKKPHSAFLWFSHDERQKVKKDFPNFKQGQVDTELEKRWAEIPKEAKKKYEKMAEDDKARYQQELTTYVRIKKGIPDK